MRFILNNGYILEGEGGFWVLSLPNERKVRMGMSQELIMVELRGCAGARLSRSLWHEYLAAASQPGYTSPPGFSGFFRWALRQPNPVRLTGAGERPLRRQERRGWKHMAHIFEALGSEADTVIAGLLVELEQECMRNMMN
jgi:hypothetical protein